MSSLAANWEIDLISEDKEFGEEMERTFEDDPADAREIRLEKSRRSESRPKVRPESRIPTSDRHDRRARRSFAGSGAAATATRVGSSALQKSAAPFDTHENTIAAAVGAALLAAAALGAKFPKAVAWPVSLIAAVLGGLGVIRAARAAKPEQMSAVPPDDAE